METASARQVYTTYSGGRLQIAVENHHVGSVEVYRNFFVRFFAGLFGISIAVTIGRKVRHVNKENYAQLLNLIKPATGLRSRWNESDFLLEREGMNFNTLAGSIVLPSQRVSMRSMISVADRARLFRKLAHAIEAGDVAGAQRMIGKGAALDIAYYSRFWTNAVAKPSFDHFWTDIGSSGTYRVYAAPPLLQALRRGMTTIFEQLLTFGANPQGKATTHLSNSKSGEYRFFELQEGSTLLSEITPDQYMYGPTSRRAVATQTTAEVETQTDEEETAPPPPSSDTSDGGGFQVPYPSLEELQNFRA